MPGRVLLLIAALPGVAWAQDSTPTRSVPDRVDQLIVYDDADCPRDTDDTIASCIVVTGESPYRNPATLRPSAGRAEVTALERSRILLQPVSGVGSCSASGAGSIYGCAGQAYGDWKAERAERDEVRYGDLIAQARARRLALIDAEATDEQTAVDELDAGPDDPMAR